MQQQISRISPTTDQHSTMTNRATTNTIGSPSGHGAGVPSAIGDVSSSLSSSQDVPRMSQPRRPRKLQQAQASISRWNRSPYSSPQQYASHGGTTSAAGKTTSTLSQRPIGASWRAQLGVMRCRWKPSSQNATTTTTTSTSLNSVAQIVRPSVA